MTAIITCNFCDKQLESGYANSSNQEFPVIIPGKNGDVIYQFNATIILKAAFNTTNVHWCKACILKAMKNQL